MGRFLSNLLFEYRGIANDLQPRTVYFGGGTPTALPTRMLDELLRGMVPSGENAPEEVTVECNPATLSPTKALALRRGGANRLSIGAQSFDPAVLATLGRTHSVRVIDQALGTARMAGFDRINLDLMFGVPGQTLASWEATLAAVLERKIPHLSCYALTFEEDTEFFRRKACGRLSQDPAMEKKMFEMAGMMLGRAGYRNYETSNHALPGHESVHNLAYWRGEDYYGIGPGAVGTVRGVRHRNGPLCDDDSWSEIEREELTPQVMAAERMALGLRTAEGVGETGFRRRFGFLPAERWQKEIQQLRDAGLLTESAEAGGAGRMWRLTDRGRLLADEAAVFFMNEY